MSVAVGVLVVSLSLTAWESDEEKLPGVATREDVASREELMRRGSEIAERALRFLASQQRHDGSFPSEEIYRQAPIAVTAIAALAFMANGSTPERGPYSVNVQLAVGWLLDCCRLPPAGADPDAASGPEADPWGYFKRDYDNNSKMHGQGYATLALAEAYGMFGISGGRTDKSQQLRRCLELAVACIERGQTLTGGWGYLPNDTFHEGSVTITQIQALRAARNCGIAVGKETIERAVQYVRDSQWLAPEDHPSYGGFRYQRNDTRVTFALTAGAVATLNATGDYDSRVIDLGLDYMQRKDPWTRREEEYYAHYSRLYAGQAYYQYRDPGLFWRHWYPTLLEVLESEQSEKDGSFTDSNYGRCYATAMSALTVAIPFGYLPILQR
ncbi:MAG: hypothetical protein AB1486_07360 [Planctomycetota bacterium]